MGLGPGVDELLTPMARRALELSSHWVGYREYLARAASLVDPGGHELHPFPMGGELDRCRLAVGLARDGERVALVSGGDPGIYGMAGPLLSMAEGIEVEVVPGLPALSAVAAKLGAPLMGDFALVSLSDLLVPWEGILYRLEKAASADLVLVLYNPGSTGRRHHLSKALRVVSHWRSLDTPVGVVSRVFSMDEKVSITTLQEMLNVEFTDMGATIVVGNSRTRVVEGRMVTDRGYSLGCRDTGGESHPPWLTSVELGDKGLEGGEIEQLSLNFILNGLSAYSFSAAEMQVVARAVHAVADFSIVPLVRFYGNAAERGVELLKIGAPVWLDTGMALAGVSKGIAERLGCPVEVSRPKDTPPPGFTRSAWAFEGLGDSLEGSIVVIGNAPTALDTVCSLAARGIRPGLVIGVPVGFVGTVRAKRALLNSGLPCITLLGNRGGTPVAVAMLNAMLRLAIGDGALP